MSRRADLWTPLIRLTEAMTMLDMDGPEARALSRDLEPIRERLLTLAKHPRARATTPTTTKGAH